MALYPSRCPIRPVDSDIRSLSKGCKSQIVKKNRNKGDLDVDDEAGVNAKRVPSPFDLRVFDHRSN